MQKRRSYRSPRYMEFIRSLPCVVTGMENGYTDIVAHHVRMGAGAGVGQKPSDYWCLPLDAKEHTKLHQVGEARYWQGHGVNPHELIAMNLVVYAARLISSRQQYTDDITAIEDFIESLRAGG